MSTLKSLLKEDVLDLKKILNNVDKFKKYPKTLQLMLKKVSVVWSQDDDVRRVLALMIIMKTVKNNLDYFSACSRGMYLVYVKNSKFIYGSIIGKNNFMKNSLLEVYSLQLDEAYKHAFVFIRQLAIILRKAYLRVNKEDTRAVYNWQFICSLRFWSEFIARNADSHELIKSLTHPLVQVILGTVRLTSGNRWISIRFHCVDCLHMLAGVSKLWNMASLQPEDKSAEPLIGNVLIPSLPLLLNIFRLFDFNKRASTASKAPMDLRLMLHFSPSQRRETACIDAVHAWLFDLLTESLTLYASSVAFPEYSRSAVTEMRAFIKTCRVANFSRDFKSLLKKVEEHSKMVEKQRLSIKSILDLNAVTNLEQKLAEKDTPLLSFYISHRKLRVTELTRLAERFKDEGQMDDTAYTEAFKTDNKQTKSGKSQKTDKKDRRHRDARGDDEEGEYLSDGESDESYDYDDGKTVTHISRSGKPKEANSDDNETEYDDEESDFDLEHELNEEEKVEEVLDKNDNDSDEVTDFKLENSDEETPSNQYNVDMDSLSDPSDGEDIEMTVQKVKHLMNEKNKKKKVKQTKKISKQIENKKKLTLRKKI